MVIYESLATLRLSKTHIRALRSDPMNDFGLC